MSSMSVRKVCHLGGELSYVFHQSDAVATTSSHNFDRHTILLGYYLRAVMIQG